MLHHTCCCCEDLKNRIQDRNVHLPCERTVRGSFSLEIGLELCNQTSQWHSLPPTSLDASEPSLFNHVCNMPVDVCVVQNSVNEPCTHIHS